MPTKQAMPLNRLRLKLYLTRNFSTNNDHKKPLQIHATAFCFIPFPDINSEEFGDKFNPY
jgi:hypothetical protein